MQPWFKTSSSLYSGNQGIRTSEECQYSVWKIKAIWQILCQSSEEKQYRKSHWKLPRFYTPPLLGVRGGT